MEEQNQQNAISCLLFVINNFFYGIKNEDIHEIMELPALKLFPGYPSYFAGILDYRGETIGVIDSRICIGFPLEKYSLTDVLVIVKEDSQFFGIILPPVFDIQDLISAKQVHFSQFMAEPAAQSPIISQTAKFKDEIVFILDTKALWSELKVLYTRKGEHVLNVTPDHYPSFLSKVPEEYHEIFQERARRLSEFSYRLEGLAENVSLTILLIKDKQFAIESEKIKEFCYLSEYAPIPGQSNLLGFMNLRGDILPLADIWRLIYRQETTSYKPLAKVLVLDYQDGLIGIVVDEALNVIAVDPSAFCEVPVTTEEAQRLFVKQAVKYENHTIGILDIGKIVEAII